MSPWCSVPVFLSERLTRYVDRHPLPNGLFETLAVQAMTLDADEPEAGTTAYITRVECPDGLALQLQTVVGQPDRAPAPIVLIAFADERDTPDERVAFSGLDQ